MAPLQINSIISGFGFPASGAVRPQPGQGNGSQVEKDRQADTFVAGQWWRNHARSPGAAGGESAQVYRRTDVRVRRPETPAEAAGRESEQLRPETTPANRAEPAAGPSASAAETLGLQKANGEPMSAQEMQVLQALQKADQAVRVHETAHLAAAGGLAKGGASFTYQRGPDGKNYAVAGEVQIDTSPEPNAEATVKKMRQVRRAALAPADPSPQDQKVAAQATIKMGEAMQELQLATPLTGARADDTAAETREDAGPLAASHAIWQDTGLALTTDRDGRPGPAGGNYRRALGVYGGVVTAAGGSSLGALNTVA